MPIPAPLKRLLRPLVFRVRRTRQRAGRWLRPPRPWDGRHHPALLRFEPWRGEADGVHQHDFLGIKTAVHFRPQFSPDPAGPFRGAHPLPYPGYFEWAFVLESVVSAAERERFTMMELGAGYGPWLVTAHRAMQRLAGPPVRLVAVEMVPHHFAWLHEHFRNNGIDPAEHLLIQAAVSDCDGEALFLSELDADFGQQVIERRPGAPPTPADTPPPEADRAAKLLATRARVASVDLARLLREEGPVDLLHVDIQGEERRALGRALPELDRQVRRLIVATHSRGIHRDLRRALMRAGWTVVYDFRCRARERTEFGDVEFLDGLLAAANPHLP